MLRQFAIITTALAVPIVVCASASLDAIGQVIDGPAAYAPTEIAITLERTGCAGTCPVYTVTIDGLGGVSYEGHEHVTHTGVRRGAITMEQVEVLLNEFLRARFMQALDQYDAREFVTLQNGWYQRMGAGVSDVPGAVLTLTLGSRTKRVVLRHDVPMELGRLPNLVDIAANTEQWTGRVRVEPSKAPGA
jgi:hypothetical protein